VDALMREADIDDQVAAEIAKEVEKQIIPRELACSPRADPRETGQCPVN